MEELIDNDLIFNFYTNDYIKTRKANGLPYLKTSAEFKTLISNYYMFTQNRENKFIPSCLIGLFYELVNFRI